MAPHANPSPLALGLGPVLPRTGLGHGAAAL